ncbi:hypothetical protein F0562_004407 [Nyssa sinensis]|uniref:Uncharacterized protein n=1 Tax=Nyssa sinensis TaxID=561372 RepID=A0A5J5BYG3_9ASTE|nr:hypothetical protein F0562_004407 [Nyssa sinensis]
MFRDLSSKEGPLAGVQGFDRCDARYKMPVEEEERKKTGDSDEEGRGRREGFRVSVYIGGSDRGDSDSGPETPLDHESS